MVHLNDCCLAVNWHKIHDFRDKACQMSQVRPRLLDDIAMRRTAATAAAFSEQPMPASWPGAFSVMMPSGRYRQAP